MADLKDGLMKMMGMRIDSASADEVVMSWDVDERHHQPMGIAHGGMYCAAVESACSIGATLAARAIDPNLRAVGLDNSTSFLRAVRSGRLRCIAKPITRGRNTQLWEAAILDEQERVVAKGQLRLLCVPSDRKLG